jgi:hypothetical protein
MKKSYSRYGWQADAQLQAVHLKADRNHIFGLRLQAGNRKLMACS